MGYMLRSLFAVLVATVMAVPGVARAVTLEAYDSRVSINGYLDLQYRFMDPLPVDPLEDGILPLAEGDSVSSLDQDQLNLLLKVDRDRFRVGINVFSHRGFNSGSGGAGGTGRFEVMEAYGEYRKSAHLNFRGGKFLAPFGIYNQYRYAISLFAPVVLPAAYEALPNYMNSLGLDELVPQQANLMVYGVLGESGVTLTYHLYTGTGQRAPDGSDTNDDKGVGARLFAGFGKAGHQVGVSYYTVKNNNVEGRHQHGMVSFDLHFGNTSLEAEAMAVRTANDTATVDTRFLRLSHKIGDVTPFVGVDYFTDDGNIVYTGGMTRWSAGAGYEVSSNLYLKAEYHYHIFEGGNIPAAVDSAHMGRVAAVMVF